MHAAANGMQWRNFEIKHTARTARNIFRGMDLEGLGTGQRGYDIFQWNSRHWENIIFFVLIKWNG